MSCHLTTKAQTAGQLHMGLSIPSSGISLRLLCSQDFNGADVRFGDVSNKDSLRSVAFSEPVDVVVSCLASRTGGKVSKTYECVTICK